MLIQFTKPVGPYNAGESAGFPDAEAQRFVSRGVAHEIKDDGYTTADIPESPENTQMTPPSRGRGRGRAKK